MPMRLRNRAGGASRALTAAKLSTNWRDSSLQRPVSTEEFRILAFLVLPCPRADGIVHPGRSWLRCRVRSKGAAKGDVHRQLGTEEQRETCREHLCGPIIVRGHSKVHVAEFRVVSHGGPGLHSGARARVLPDRHAALWRPLLSSGTPHSQRTSVTCRGNLTLSKMMVRKSSASIRNSGFEGHPHNTSKCERKWAARLVQHCVLPEVVFGRRRSVVLPAVRPLPKFCTDVTLWSDSHPDAVPIGSAHEAVPVKQPRCVVQLAQTAGMLVCIQRNLWSIMCRASAHDAQYAPGAILCALKEAMLRAMSCS